MDKERMQPSATAHKLRDRELLAAIAEGDRQALGDLYLRHHRRLVRFLSRFTSSYESIEEIVNDTFLVVWQSARDFRSESQVSTWVISIAHRKLMNLLRKQRSTANADSAGADPDSAVDPTSQTEVQDWLLHGLSRLPVDQRMTLELAFHMGHTVEEIAFITDSPVSTVKGRMFQARKKLRRYLPALSGEADSGTRGSDGGEPDGEELDS